MSRKLTIDEIKERIRKIHGDVVILDESTYVNTRTKCRFVDKDYGEWWTTPCIVYKGHGHPKRGLTKIGESLALPVDEVKKRIEKIHGNIVVLDESTYVNATVKARFIDKDYGEWWATPNNVIYGLGHRKRGRDKSRQTCLKKYNVDNPLKYEKFKGKSKQTCLKNYGTENPMHNKEIKEKVKQTNLEKYGTECSLYNPEIQKKVRQTMLKRHGVEYPSQCEEMKEKSRQTSLKNYGVEYPSQCEEIKNKIKQTNLERYGVENPMQDPEIALKAAKSQNNSYVLEHWETGEEVICTAGYEKATVEYFNINQTNYNWQTKAFKMPNGKTYRPDCYLPDQDLWIEIKGYFREKAKEKWEWFHKEYPNSELWNEKKLKELKIL